MQNIDVYWQWREQVNWESGSELMSLLVGHVPLGKSKDMEKGDSEVLISRTGLMSVALLRCDGYPREKAKVFIEVILAEKMQKQPEQKVREMQASDPHLQMLIFALFEFSLNHSLTYQLSSQRKCQNQGKEIGKSAKRRSLDQGRIILRKRLVNDQHNESNAYYSQSSESYAKSLLNLKYRDFLGCLYQGNDSLTKSQFFKNLQER